MSEDRVRVLAEKYVDAQLQNVKATVTSEKRAELVESAIRIVDPRRDRDSMMA